MVGKAKHDLSIIWNLIAASHGKGCVDGIGGTIKRPSGPTCEAKEERG